jgi:hypothetical protein
MNKIGIASLLAIVVAIALGLGGPPGPRDSGPAAAHELGTVDPNGLIQHPQCIEVIPDLIEVDYQTAGELVPEGYTLAEFNAGTAHLAIVANFCESVTVGGVTLHDVIMSYMRLALVPYDSPSCQANGGEAACPDPPPHGSYLRPVSGAPADIGSIVGGAEGGESYLLQWVTNKKEVARWLKRATGLGEEVVRYVPDLEFRYNPQPADTAAGHPVDEAFFFRAPPPAPVPFHIGCDPDDAGCAAVCATDGTGCEGCEEEQSPPGCGDPACDYLRTECARATQPYAGEFDVGENQWRDTDAGTVIIFGEHLVGGSRVGGAGGTITSDDPDSPLGILFGANQTRSTASGNSTEDNLQLEWITAEFTGDVQWTKCVRSLPQNPCSPEEHSDPCLPVTLDPACDLLAEPLLLTATALPLTGLSVSGRGSRRAGRQVNASKTSLNSAEDSDED